MKTTQRIGILAAIFMSVLAMSVARASVMFTGIGTNPEVNKTAAGSANFTIAGNVLTLVLTNTTLPRTAEQGNALTGIVFDINAASPTLSLTSTALTGGSAIWTSKTASNTSDPLAGSWTNQVSATPLAAYGVATTGFNGAFNGGSIGLGNASPNYGIVAAHTFNGSNVAFGGSRFPFIQDSMTFTFSGLTGINESQITNVQFLFGTDGTGNIPDGGGSVPEPSTFSLLAIGAFGLLGHRRR